MGFYRFLKDEDAPAMVEYGILLAFIAIVAVVGVAMFGLAVLNELYQLAIDAFP